jgi:hypothetical protein
VGKTPSFLLEYDVSECSPTLARFHRSNAEFKGVEGPIGSGKSVACCIEVFRRCQQQKLGPDGLRRSRWVVVRNTKQQLKDTTLKTWFDWFPPTGTIGYWRATDMAYYLEFGDVRAEILFRALDTPEDVAKVLSLELTGAWLNECRQIRQEIAEGLRGRLKRYPRKKDGGSNYWMMIADTNMPTEGTYWWKLFEKRPLREECPESITEFDGFRQPSGLSPEAENVPFLEDGYYTSQLDRSPEFVNVMIKAEYGQSLGGKPVYLSSFQRKYHVARTSLPIDPMLPVIVGQDWGLTPAGLWMQMQADGTIYILRETPRFNIDAKQYIRTVVRPLHMNVFPLNPIVIVGDPAGKRRADSDGNTCFKVCKAEGYTAVAAPTTSNDPVVRIQALTAVFTDFPNRRPKALIDPSCARFIEGCQTGYKFRRKRFTAEAEYDDKPDKNYKYSHLMEGGQYGVLFLISGNYRPEKYYAAPFHNPYVQQSNYRPATSAGY